MGDKSSSSIDMFEMYATLNNKKRILGQKNPIN